MFRCVVGERLNQWDATLPQVEFAFTSMMNCSTRKSPFDIVYTKGHNHIIDLLQLPQYKNKSVATLVEQMQQLYAEVHQHLEVSNERYKEVANHHRRYKSFQEWELVMVFLRRECCPVGNFSKLSAHKIGPCRVIHKISDNAYSIDLPFGLNISNTFNVADLHKYNPLDEAPISSS